MTYEEAIKQLNYIAVYHFDKYTADAINMAIDALEKQIPKKPVIRKAEDYFENIKYTLSGQKTLGDIADHLITNGVTVKEWISVKDRLPKNGVRVLAAHDDGVVRIGICRGYFPAVVSKNHTKTFGIAEVTHWMPLPEPPKGK